MNVTQFHLTPAIYARANYLKTEIQHALTYAKKHLNKTQEIVDFFGPISDAAAAGTLLPLVLKPQRYMRANDLRSEVKQALNFCKAQLNKRTVLSDFFTEVYTAFSALVEEPVEPLTITLTTLPNATEGGSYNSGSFAVTGGVPPYSYSLNSGSLPSNLSVSGSGFIFGDLDPATAGTYNFVIQVTDDADGVDTQAYELVVEAA